MKDQNQDILDLVHQFSTRLRESNNANRRAVENSELVYQLKDLHRKYVLELTDTMTPEDRMEYLEEQIRIINSQIIYHAKQEREWRIIRNQRAEEIRQIKSENPEAEKRIDEILKNR